MPADVKTRTQLRATPRLLVGSFRPSIEGTPMTIARLRVSWLWSLTLLLLAVFSSTAHAQANCPGNKPGRYAVKIDSAPQGAAVYINDKSCPAVGVTPWEGKLNSADYTVIVEAPGYDLATRPFKVAKVRKTQEMFIPLVKKLDPPKI